MIGTEADLPDNFEQLITPGIRPGDLYLASSSRHGQGVFAARTFRPDVIIEICPVIIVPAAQRAALDTTLLFDHYYEWKDAAGLALGFGSLYNHSYTPNAGYRQHLDRGLVIVTALKAIAKDEEITINYNGDPADQSSVWYEKEGSPGRQATGEG
jgi:uncharacterized protein